MIIGILLASGKPKIRIEVIIAKVGKPMARISRIEESSSKIRFGVLKGKVKVSENFDAPLLDDLLSKFEEN